MGAPGRAHEVRVLLLWATPAAPSRRLSGQTLTQYRSAGNPPFWQMGSFGAFLDTGPLFGRLLGSFDVFLNAARWWGRLLGSFASFGYASDGGGGCWVRLTSCGYWQVFSPRVLGGFVLRVLGTPRLPQPVGGFVLRILCPACVAALSIRRLGVEAMTAIHPATDLVPLATAERCTRSLTITLPQLSEIDNASAAESADSWP
jgi:hypothetical protein